MQDGALVVVDKLEATEKKTKATAALLKRLGATGKTLVIDVTPQDDFTLTARNIAGLSVVASSRVTARDVMDTTRVIATREAIEKLQESLGNSSRLSPARLVGTLALELTRNVMKLTDIIRRPLITEKTTLLREAGRTIVFEVARRRHQGRHQACGREAARLEGRRRAHRRSRTASSSARGASSASARTGRRPT